MPRIRRKKLSKSEPLLSHAMLEHLRTGTKVWFVVNGKPLPTEAEVREAWELARDQGLPVGEKPSASNDKSRSPRKRGQPDAEWRELLGNIPGYDPCRDSEGFWFDDERAEIMLDFFPQCLQFIEGDVAGQPFVLEPWCQAIVANLYGWKRLDNNTRRYREALVFVARKNIKTTLGAGLVLATLFCDGEKRAQCYSAAADREQASLAFDIAKLMVAAEPHLSDRCKAYQKSIVIPEDGSFYKSLSAEAYTKHGLGAHFVLSDELHVQPNRELIDVLKTSTAARSQPLVVHITTSDYERPDSICNEIHDYACKVRDGIINDPTFLPVIYEASISDDWTDEAVWAKANPNLHKSVSIEYLRKECLRAQETPPYENVFKRLHLNIRTQQDVRWIPMDKWDACAGNVDAKALHKQTCYGGLDLASTSDITCLVLAFPRGNKFQLLPFYWVPQDSANKRDKRDRTTYQKWIDQGVIRTTRGDMTDYGVVRKDINELANKYGIRKLAIDRMFQGAQLAQELAQDGFDVDAFNQSVRGWAAPTLEFDRLIRTGDLEHGNCPVLNWMASNISVSVDNHGNMMPCKKKSTEKIDGIVSAIMAVALCMANTKTQSVYATRGVIAL